MGVVERGKSLLLAWKSMPPSATLSQEPSSSDPKEFCDNKCYCFKFLMSGNCTVLKIKIKTLAHKTMKKANDLF